MALAPTIHLHPAAPVLVLPEGAIQVGWDKPLILARVSAPQARFLQSLEGGRRLGVAESRKHAQLLRQLEEAGLLVRRLPGAAQPPCVRIHGAGAVGTEAAVTIARAGLSVAVVDGARARRSDVPHLPEPDCAAVAVNRVRTLVPQAQIRGAHADAVLDVVISAGPALVRTRELLSANQAHLLVECGEREVTVGPVVVPGTTACGICLGLYATAERAHWPVLALQADSRRPRVAPATATLAGALVAHEVLAFVNGGATGQWRVSAEQVQAVEPRAPHPDCRCTSTAVVDAQAAADIPAWPQLTALDKHSVPR